MTDDHLRWATGLDATTADVAGLVAVIHLDGHVSYTHPVVHSAVTAVWTDQEVT